MLRIIILFSLLCSNSASAADLSAFFVDGDNRDITASKVIESKEEPDTIIMWVGKVSDISVYVNDDGATAIEWFCEQYPFAKQPTQPFEDPLMLLPDSSGHFVVTLNLPDLSVSEVKEKIIEPLESPSWVLVRGEPVLIRSYKGTPSVFLHSLGATVSDTLKVEYVNNR